MKKTIAFILTIVMIISLLPASVFAAEWTEAPEIGINVVKNEDGTLKLTVVPKTACEMSSFEFDLRYPSDAVTIVETATELRNNNRDVFYARPTLNISESGKIAYAVATDENCEIDANGVIFVVNFSVNSGFSGDVEFEITKLTAGQTGDISKIYSENEYPSATINIPKVGVNLDKTSVVADGTNNVTVKATAINAAGADVTSTAKWTVSGGSGVSVASNGTITVNAKAAAGEYTITAAGKDFGNGATTASATLTVSRNTPVASAISVTPATATQAKPLAGADAASVAFTAAITDQYGSAFDGTVTWTVSDGVSKTDNGNTTAVAVNNTTAAGNYTVTATYGELSKSATLTVTAKASTVSSIEIFKDGTSISSDEVIVADDAAAVQYTAKAMDQYGAEMSGIVWSFTATPTALKNKVTIDQNGLVTIGAFAKCGTVTVTAKCGTKTDTVTINVKSLHDYTISKQPSNATKTYDPNGSVALSAAVKPAIEGATVTYQWMRANGTDDGAEGFTADEIAGATDANYVIENPTAGTYYYFCRAKIAYGGEEIYVHTNIATVTINPKAITKTLVSVGDCTYTGAAQTPAVTVTGLTKDVDYTVTADAKTVVGAYKLTVAGKGNYSGSFEFDWSIAAAQLSNVTADQTMDMYIGGAASKALPSFNASTVDGSAVSVSYSTTSRIIAIDGSNVSLLSGAKEGDTATVTATISAANHVSVTRTVTISVSAKAPIDVNGMEAVNNAPAVYDGSEHTLAEFITAASVAGNGTTTYKVDGVGSSANMAELKLKNAGTYTVVAEYEDETYAGSKTVTIIIAPKSIAVAWTGEGFTYNGKAQVPAASVDTGVAGETVALTVSGEQTAAGTGYTASAAMTAENSNYVLTNTTKEFSIAAKSVAVVWGETQFVFSGEAQAPAASAATGIEGESLEIAVAGAQTNVGSYTAVASTENTNYVLTNTECGYTIAKAAAPVLTVEGSTTYKCTISGEKSVTVAGVPANAGNAVYTIGAIDANTIFAEAPVVNAGVVSFKLVANNDNIGKTVTIPVSVTSDNYEDAAINIVIKIVDKDVPVIEVEGITKDYNGEVIPASAIVGKASFEGAELEGTWSWVTDMSTVVNAGNYTVNVKFSPEDTVNYGEVTATIAVVINKVKVAVPVAVEGLAYIPETEQTGVVDGDYYSVTGNLATVAGSYTAEAVLDDAVNYEWAEEFDGKIAWTIAKAMPTGKPGYTSLTAGKTLADAALTAGDIAPAGGTIKWVDADGNELPAETEVGANVRYKWQYTPVDTDNYEILTGEITLYVYYVPSAPKTNEVAVDSEVENGKIEVDVETAEPGAVVTITVTPESGYEIDKVVVTDEEGNEIAVTDNGDGTYSFEMPEGAVSISTVFAEAGLPFGDVAEEHWFHDAVYQVYYAGLMNGVSDTEFAPKTNFTRAMMVTVLARIAGVDTEGGETWYEKGLDWAVENGISDGTNITADITREQVVTMLYRYMGEPKVDEDNLAKFVDGAETSAWAVDAMNWAISVGIIEGDNANSVNPSDNATRAEIATIFARFIAM